jgi:putative sigma-54 modulation protein
MGGIMKLELVGKNIEITEGIKMAVENALGELEKYFTNKDVTAHVVVKTYTVGSKAEINIKIDANHTIRQEVMHDDLYAAISLAGKKIDKQIKKLNSRVKEHAKDKAEVIKYFTAEAYHEKEPKKIIRRKELENKPMSEAEALLQFEISGHDFYVFEDFNDEITKIIYRRKDNEYGIIELTN